MLDIGHHFRRRQTNRRKILCVIAGGIDDHLGRQERPFLTARQRRIEDNAGELGENFDIAMGLHPGRDGPFDLNWIGGIDVIIDNGHLLDAAAGGGAEHGETDVLAEAFVGFIDGKHCV